MNETEPVGAVASPPPRWRIDALAQASGVTVDTIRYYLREGLLPDAAREGRHRLYDQRHLERLERIRDLQDRRFSLAAIKALFDAERPGIEGIFAGGGRTYSLAELADRAGLDRTFLERLRAVGLLPDPAEVGREAYDETDLRMLDAVQELADIGMPLDMIVELGDVYVRNFRTIQHQVHSILAGATRPDLDPEAIAEMQRRLTARSKRLIPAVDRVLEYVHQRTVQRLTLEAIVQAHEHQRGIGGLRLTPGEHPDGDEDGDQEPDDA